MPRDTLTREKVIKAAVDLLDTDGPGKARHDDHTLAIYEAARFSARGPTRRRPAPR